ncbi:predicted protein, partial [Nematostella vectensis]
GFCSSRIIFTALELGVFDVLEESNLPLSSKAISESISTNQDATERLLDALVSMGFLKKTTSTTNPKYSNCPETKAFLLKNSNSSIHALMPMLRKSYTLFGNLTSAIREGENQWGKTGFIARVFLYTMSLLNYLLGTSIDLFSFVYATKRGLLVFLEGLRGSSKLDAEGFVTAFDLTKYKRICDLGGATGEIAQAVNKHYPESKVTVFDLPKVIKCSTEFKNCKSTGSKISIDWIGGDFFKDKLPENDLFILTRILQSFNATKIDILLARVYQQLPPGGGLLIGEKLLEDDKSGPLLGNISNLAMLVAGNKGARERSGLEYQQLLQQQGFTKIQYKKTGGTFLDAIFACK